MPRVGVICVCAGARTCIDTYAGASSRVPDARHRCQDRQPHERRAHGHPWICDHPRLAGEGGRPHGGPAPGDQQLDLRHRLAGLAGQ